MDPSTQREMTGSDHGIPSESRRRSVYQGSNHSGASLGLTPFEDHDSSSYGSQTFDQSSLNTTPSGQRGVNPALLSQKPSYMGETLGVPPVAAPSSMAPSGVNSAALTQTSSDMGTLGVPPAVPMNFSIAGVSNQKAPAGTPSRSSQTRGRQVVGHHPYRSSAASRPRPQYTPTERKEIEAASRVGYWQGRQLDGGFAVYNKSHQSIIGWGLEKPYDQLLDDRITDAIDTALDEFEAKNKSRPSVYHRLFDHTHALIIA